MSARDKASGIDAAAVIIANWRQLESDKLETRIVALSDVDALRTIAFFSRGASFPQNAEDIEVDAKLDRMFWASVKSLLKEDNKDARDALRLIERSSLLQSGDLLLFKVLGEQAMKNHGKKRNK